MAEYISREAVLALADDFEMMLADGTDEIFFEYIPIDKVRSLLAADVRPVVRGRWKLASYSGKYGSAKEKWYDQFLDGAFWYCDQCRERARKSNFCPNCGAMMGES